MLGADVKTFHHNPVPDGFRDLYADRCPRNVEDATRSTVIELVWHPFHDGRIDLDVDELADLEYLQVG